MLGMNRSTARGIVATYIREGRTQERRRGDRNNVKVDDEMKQCSMRLLMRLSADFKWNLPETSKKTPRKASRTRQDCWYCKALDGMLIRHSKTDVIRRRVEYANWFMTNGILHHCVFIDECGYNTSTARRHGRARIGERAYRQVLGQRGRNVTITSYGRVSYPRFSPLHCASCWNKCAAL